MRRTATQFLSGLALLASSPYIVAQTLAIVSGNGQIVQEQFITVAPMTVQARDAQDRPVAGAAITWSVTSGQGTLINPLIRTDSSGLANTFFLGTNVPGGSSIQQSTVTAQSSYGSASFFVTTALVRLPAGGLGAPPLVELLKPVPENRTLIGDAGSTLAGAVVIRVGVQTGPETGRAVANVGVRVYNYENPNTSPSASCRSPNGIVLTDSTGTATCDLVLNNRTGEAQLAIITGESQITPSFTLNIRAGVPCVYSLQPTTQSFPASGGSGTFSISTPATCPWTVQSNANWIVPTSNVNGTGPASISYTVLNNPGLARESSITVAGQAFAVTQAATGTSGVLSISSPGILPNGITNQPYSYTLQATGGREPYVWSVGAGLPQGLNLSAAGLISGLPLVAGTYPFPVGVTDSAGSNFIRVLTVTVTNADQSTNPTITTTSFANGAVGVGYQQIVATTGGCGNPVSGPRFAVVSGALPPGVTLEQVADRWAVQGIPTQAGAFTFTLAVTDPCGRSTSASFTITITSNAPSNSPLRAVPQTLTFAVVAGSSVRSPDQAITLLSDGQPINYIATSSTSWVMLGGGSAGPTPGNLFIGVGDFQSLPPGEHRGTIFITSPGVAPVSVPVLLIVNPAPNLIPNPAAISYNAAVTFVPGDLRQNILITGPSGTQFTARARTSNGLNWLGVTPQSGVAPSSIQTVVNHVGLGPGQYTGSVDVISAGAVVTSIPVILSVSNPPQFIWSTSGMTFAISSADPAPLPQSLTLSTTSVPVRVNVSANTLNGGNWLQVTPIAGTTPVSLSVSVDSTGLVPGQYNGEIVARSAESGLTASSIRVIMLLTETRPAITAVLHAASQVPGPLAPGSWAEIHGSFLGSTRDATPFLITDSGRIASTLADVRFLVDGVAAPIISASAQKSVIQMPYGIANRERVSIVAEFRGIRSEPFVVPVILINPAIFITEGTQGRIVNEDNSPNRLGFGAEPGSQFAIYMTGEGMTEPAGVDGLIAGENPPRAAVLPVQVWVDGQEAEVVTQGGIPGMPAGIFLVRAKVPQNTQRGVPVAVTVGINGNYTPDLVTMIVKPPPAQ